jgi:hypothetical protein
MSSWSHTSAQSQAGKMTICFQADSEYKKHCRRNEEDVDGAMPMVSSSPADVIGNIDVCSYLLTLLRALNTIFV